MADKVEEHTPSSGHVDERSSESDGEVCRSGFVPTTSIYSLQGDGHPAPSDDAY